MKSKSSRWIAAVGTSAIALLTGACSSSSGGDSPSSIVGTWDYANASTNSGLGATFNSDGTYVLDLLRLTSGNAADAQAETGTYTVSGNTITTTPQKSSCPGPDPVSSATYSFQGSNLELVQPSGIVVLQPDTTMASNIALAIGCFDSSGNFTAEPLAPVTN